MSKCGNNDCQWHKFCEGGLIGMAKILENVVIGLSQSLPRRKSIKVAESDYDKAVKVLKRNKIEFK